MRDNARLIEDHLLENAEFSLRRELYFYGIREMRPIKETSAITLNIDLAEVVNDQVPCFVICFILRREKIWYRQNVWFFFGFLKTFIEKSMKI